MQHRRPSSKPYMIGYEESGHHKEIFMLKLLPTILALLTTLAVAVAVPVQTFVMQNPIASFVVALAGIIAAHFTPPPQLPGKGQNK